MCAFCPDGQEVTDDMLGCEEETFLGLTELQWAAVGTALAACSLLAGAVLTLRNCRKKAANEEESNQNRNEKLPVVQAVGSPVSSDKPKPIVLTVEKDDKVHPNEELQAALNEDTLEVWFWSILIDWIRIA